MFILIGNEIVFHVSTILFTEAKRRKWLEDNPESSSNEDPVFFDTSIVPWWAWIKRYHLPEAELLNGIMLRQISLPFLAS